MDTKEDYLKQIVEMANFPRRIEKPTRYLPYVEDLVLVGETAIVLKIQEVWDTYNECLRTFLLGLSRKRDLASMSLGVIDEVYERISKVEKEYYEMVSEYIMEDLRSHLRHSFYPLKEVNVDLNSAEKSLRKLATGDWKSLGEMHSEYMELMDKLDTINAQLLGHEMESKARFWRRILVVISGGIIVGIVLGLLSPLWV